MSDNYYEQSNVNSIERAVLAEDIVFNTLTNISAKFYTLSMTPSESTDSPKITNRGSYKQSNYMQLTIPAYMLLSFVQVPIKTFSCTCEDCSSSGSSYNILSFPATSGKVPKGTEFIVTFLGGEVEVEKAVIIGVYNVSATQASSSSGNTSRNRK